MIVFLGCPSPNKKITFISGLGATLNVAKPPKGSTVAVFGLGAVGLSVSIVISIILLGMISKVACCLPWKLRQWFCYLIVL